MTRPLVVLRPRPGLEQTLAEARELGLQAIAAPLFAITPVPWEAPGPAGFDGIVAGSANAFRQGGGQLRKLNALPVQAVGERTAEAARDAGFAVALVGTGGLQQLFDRMTVPRTLLRLAGERRVELHVPPGVELVERVVYRAEPLPLDRAVADELRKGAVVLLHSGEAARRFADECDRLAIDRTRVMLAALAPRIAETAGEGWQTVASAPEPNDAALLVMAADMCQTRL